ASTVVTNGLEYYWNPKDGIKTGNTLRNLAPQAVTSAMTISGGAQIVNGAVVCDGIDDYLSYNSPTQYDVIGKDSTYEIIFTPNDISGTTELLYGGFFIGILENTDLYASFPRGGGLYRACEILD